MKKISVFCCVLLGISACASAGKINRETASLAPPGTPKTLKVLSGIAGPWKTLTVDPFPLSSTKLQLKPGGFIRENCYQGFYPAVIDNRITPVVIQANGERYIFDSTETVAYSFKNGCGIDMFNLREIRFTAHHETLPLILEITYGLEAQTVLIVARPRIHGPVVSNTPTEWDGDTDAVWGVGSIVDRY